MIKIKTFQQACKKLGLNPKRCLPGVSRMLKQDQAATLAFARLVIVARALNDGWEPDWNNYNEYKYFPWFWMNKPGFRLFVIDCDLAFTHATGGSRLCFRSRELAEHAAKYFKKDYEALMCLPKKAARKAAKK